MIDFKAQVPRLAAILLVLLVLGLALLLGAGFYQKAAKSQEITSAQASLTDAKDKLQKIRAQREQFDTQVLQLGTRPPGWDWGDQMPVMVMQVTAIVEGRG
ncbi:MAG TPA: hypothetical protein VGM23_16510, partial [Armatimonadota bacterium]